MKTLNELDRATVRRLQERMIELLKPLEKEFNVNVTAGGGSFAPTDFTAKFKVALVLNGEVKSGEAMAFEAYAESFGLQSTDLGRHFISRGTRYKIVGLKPNAPKYPVLGERADGKRFKFPATTVKFGLQVEDRS